MTQAYAPIVHQKRIGNLLDGYDAQSRLVIDDSMIWLYDRLILWCLFDRLCKLPMDALVYSWASSTES